MQTLHLFAGAGGGLLADLILGHTPIGAVELDTRRAELLREMAARGWWPELEVVNEDVRSFDGRRWSGKVDCIHAGIPCPRWSSARRGAGNPEDYWSEVLRITGETRPEFLFLESVPGIGREHGRFRRDLYEIGYTLKDGIVTDACSVGAPHSRRRYWALGYSNGDRESMCSFDGEMAELPEIAGCGWWETDPRHVRVDDGLAAWNDALAAAGDGQVPLQAALAWKILGGP